MFVFFDTEFTDTVRAQPLSIGMYAERGAFSWYGELPIPLDKCSAFVKAEVLPQMGPRHYPACREGKDPAHLKALLMQDLSRAGLELKDLIFVADFQGDFDILSGILQESFRKAWPQEVLPEALQSVKTYLAGLITARSGVWEANPTLKSHHALFDAWALEKAYQAAWLASAY